MTSEASVHRRIVRRETHSSRAGWAITVAIVLMLLLASAGVADVYLIAHPPVLTGARAGFAEFARSRSTITPVALATGVAAAVAGVLLMVIALTPGRRPRRRLASDRAAAVVDDKVIARALARKAAEAAALPRSQVAVVVGRRRAAVRVTPTAGVAVDRSAVADAVQCAGAPYGLTRHSRVIVAERAVVG